MQINYKIAEFVLIFIAMDIVTGLLKGWKTKSLNSTKMREGLIAKLAELAALLFGILVENTLPEIGIDIEVKFALLIGTYLILMEACSIIENIAAINETIGKMLGGVFEKVNSQYGYKGDHRDE